MRDLNLLKASAAELQTMLQNGQLTSVQLVRSCLDQIAKYNKAGPVLRAIYAVSLDEDILAVAEALDKERAEGRVRGPQHGIPVIVKVRNLFSSMKNI